jgi:hypothetical protein
MWLPVSAGAVAIPVVTGPIATSAPLGDPSHDYPFFSFAPSLADYRYVEEEFFIEGIADRYSTPTLASGSVLSSGHPYKTRLLVRRPATARRFNGTVLVEWLNVTAGFELDGIWAAGSWEHFVRAGYAWVACPHKRLASTSP